MKSRSATATKRKSRILAEMHETARDLRRMGEFELLCTALLGHAVRGTRCNP